MGLEGDCIWALLRVLLSVVDENPEEEAKLGRLSDSKQETERKEASATVNKFFEFLTVTRKLNEFDTSLQLGCTSLGLKLVSPDFELSRPLLHN